MGNINSLKQFKINGNDINFKSKNMIEYFAIESNITFSQHFSFDDEISDKCTEIFTQIYNTDQFVNVGLNKIDYCHYVIYYISDINDHNIIYSSSKIFPTTWGWKLK